MKPTEGVTAEIVVQHVRSLIERGELRPGDRLPPERELAVQLGVSRPSVRAGLRSLAAIGVLQTRHGAGTFITDGPPTLGSEPLSFLAALHGFTRDEMFEARRALEVGVAGLAAERATDDQIATIAEEVTGMFASLDDAQAFLIHDIRFHRAVAAASGNPILASMVEMVSALFYEQRKKTANNGRDLKQSAQAHRNIYHAIRAHDAKRARAAMSEHLSLAQQAQALEGAGERRFQQASASLSLEQVAHRARRGPRLLVAPPAPSSPTPSSHMPYAPLDLTGRAAVVIGGTSGIGRVLARALAEAGADVVPTSRRADLVDEAAADIEARGRRALRVPSDVNDRASLEALLAASIAAFGKVDIMVNCAGRTKRVPTLDLDEADWNAILETNLTGTLRAAQIFGRHMVDRGYGRIVNIASLSSFVALFEVAAYAASKAGVASLTKSLAVEWAPRGVTVNAIAPGVFRTPLNQNLLDGTDRGREFLLRTPMKRFGRLEELAGAAVFLSSEAASFVTGEVLVVDGGFLASGVNQ